MWVPLHVDTNTPNYRAKYDRPIAEFDSIYKAIDTYDTKHQMYVGRYMLCFREIPEFLRFLRVVKGDVEILTQDEWVFIDRKRK